MTPLEITNLRQLFNSPEGIKLAKVIASNLDDDTFNEVILGGKWESINNTKMNHDCSYRRMCCTFALKVFTFSPYYKSINIAYQRDWCKVKRFQYDLNGNHEIQAKRLRKYLNEILWFN